MPLKNDIHNVFENSVENELSKEEIIDEIVSAYKDAVSQGVDQYGNKWNISNYTLLEKAILAQFDLAFNTSIPLQFSLIETSLIATWASATLVLPAIPAPGMSVVASGSVTVSTVVGTPPLGPAIENGESNFDPIVNAFTNMFKNHAKSISYLYVGSSTSAPPVPISVPGAGITLM